MENGDNSLNSRFFQGSRFLINKANNRFFIDLGMEENNEDFESINTDKIDRLPKPQNRGDKVDVLIITAAPGEQEALHQCMDRSKDSLGKTSSSWEKRISSNSEYYQQQFTCKDGRKITVASVNSLDYGQTQVTLTISEFARVLKPRCLAIVGICAGYKKEVSLGDVIVAEKLFQAIPGQSFSDIRTYQLKRTWYKHVKEYENNLKQIDWANLNAERPKSYEYQSHWLLHTLFQCQDTSSIENHPDRGKECPNFGNVVRYLEEDGLLEWTVEAHLRLTSLGLDKVKKARVLGLKVEEPEFPRIWFRPVATGSGLLENDDAFENIRKEHGQRYACGYDMEGYSVAESAWYNDVEEMIFVKAVSDYGDSQRGRNGHFRKYSCKAAATFLIHFLKEHYFD